MAKNTKALRLGEGPAAQLHLEGQANTHVCQSILDNSAHTSPRTFAMWQIHRKLLLSFKSSS